MTLTMPLMNKHILSALPQTARVLAEVIGPQATLALSERLYQRRHISASAGLLNLSIPKTIARSHWIMETLGLSKSKMLSKEFGGEKLPLCRCRNIERSKRNAQIIAEKESGKSVEDIAKEFHLTTKAVVFILDPVLAERNRQRVKARGRIGRRNSRNSLPTPPPPIGSPSVGHGAGTQNSLGSS